MAEYGVKYRFRWNDEGGGDWRIDICQAGYTGDILPRAIGASSVSLRRDRNGNICGTSLELTAECRVDEEFAELYTTDPFEFKVLVYAESVCIWTGYVTPELYSEPFIAPPYDVKVTASDNLGELKLTEWVGVGRLTFAQLLNTLLAQTGLSMGVKYISTLATGSISARAFFSTVTIDLDELSGKSYYDVLDQLLASFHAVLFQHGGSWVVLRETDVVPSISGGAVVPAGQSAGMPIRSLGSAYAGGLWPENHVDLTVEPAKKAISLICPELWNRYGTASITNPSTGNATGTLTATFAAADGINLNDSSTTSRYPLALNIEALRKNRSNKVYYDIVVKVQGNGVTRYLVENTDAAEGYAWQSSSASIKITPGDKLYYAGRGDVSASKSGEVTSIPFPNCDDITALTKIEVTLTSNTIATSYRPTRYLPSVYFFGAWISYDDQFTSLMDTIAINNNARGAASDVNLIVSGLTDVALEKYFISNSLLDGSGSLLGAVHTSAFEGQDYISLLSRDYALSIAAPRLKAEGVFYGQERTDLPLFMSMGGLRYVIETWDWNLITGGVDFSALTLPAATITVTSETIVTGDNLGHGTSSGSGGSGGSGGASSSGAGYVAPGTGVPALTEAYIGTTRVQPSPTEDQDLTGIGNATLSGKLNLPQGAYLEVVNVGTTASPVYAIHTNIGLYSDSFVSAFGASDTGGGGGGLIQTVYGTSGFGGTYSDTDYTNTFNAYAINTLYDRIVALEGASVNISVNVTGSGNAVTNGSYNNGVITLTKGATFLTSVAFADLTAHPTTLAGYGITDAKIQNGVITLGGNTITPMTSIGTGSVTNAMLAGSIANGKLANSAITINGSSTALGGSFNTASITAGTAGTSSATSGLSIAIPYVTLNQYGIVTGYGTHTHSISKANITSAIGSTTYAPYNSAGYLPLSGGTMTGDIKMTTGEYIQSEGGYAMCGLSSAGNFYSGPGYEVSAAFLFRSGNINLTHRRFTTSQSAYNDYTVWDGANSNLSTVNWAAKNLTAAGTLAVTGASTLTGLLTANGGITVASSKSITLGDGVLTWDTNAQAWKLTGNLYATGFISAFGASDTGGGGGGINLNAMWANLQVNESGTTGYNLQINPGHLTTALGTYVNAITTTGSGNAITAVSKSGSTLTFTKGSTFALASRTVTGTGYLTGGGALSANRTIDIASTYKGYIDEGHTAYGWGDHAQAGYLTGITSSMVTTALGFTPANSTALGNYLPLAGGTMTGNITFAKSGATTDGFPVLALSSITGGWDRKLYEMRYDDTRMFHIGVYGNNSTFSYAYLGSNGYNGNNLRIYSDKVQFGDNVIWHAGNLTSSAITDILASGSIANGKLANSSITINGTSTSLGGTFNTASITAGTAGTSSATSGLSFAVPYVTLNAYGVATAYGTHTHTISASNITTAIGSTTYAPYNAAGYLPLSGGTMTGDLVLGNAINIQANDSGGTARTIMGLNSSNVLHIGYSTAGQGYITRIYGSDIEFRYGSGRAIGMTLGSDGKLVMESNIVLPNSIALQAKASDGTARGIVHIDTSNNVRYGYASAAQGYNTYLHGNNVYLTYGTSRTTGVTLNSSGNVGIGNTSPLGKLHVTGRGVFKQYGGAQLVIGNTSENQPAGSILFQSNPQSTEAGARNGFKIESEAESTSSSFSCQQLTFYRSRNTTSPYAPSWVAVMTISGRYNRVGIANTAPAYTLDVTGTIHSTVGIYSDGYVSAFGQSTTSDARLKKDFRDTTLTVDDIAHAPAITFLWKDREGKRQAGSLAQYWETVLPEVVTDIEGKKGLDYGAAALVSAITIARDVNDHEKRIRELERENRELKRRLGYGIQ